jgi:hypothetical protein
VLPAASVVMVSFTGALLVACGARTIDVGRSGGSGGGNDQPTSVGTATFAATGTAGAGATAGASGSGQAVTVGAGTGGGGGSAGSSNAGGSGIAGRGGTDAGTDGPVTLPGNDGGLGAPCRSSLDCGSSDGGKLRCVAPGMRPPAAMCTSCPPSECATNSDCAPKGPAMICIQSCDGLCFTNICKQGCLSNADCPGFLCNPDHTCGEATCSATRPCPMNFQCAIGFCMRTPCTSDARCTGHCVQGQCYDTFGTCSP